MVGDRAGNFVVQNADLILVLGSRLNMRQLSYNWKALARHAFKAMVDVDWAELRKPPLSLDLPIHADLKDFLGEIDSLLPERGLPARAVWDAWAKERGARYDVVLPEYWETKDVNPYSLTRELSRALPENELLVFGDVTACITSFQAAEIKSEQRRYTNSGYAAMGHTLTPAIGTYRAGNPEHLICITGNGSIQTVVHNRLIKKTLVLNNRGYHSIRQTQQNYFPDNVVGCGTASALSFPEITDLDKVYGFEPRKLRNHGKMRCMIDETLFRSGPQLSEVILNLQQRFAPKLSSRNLADGRMISSPLKDLAPLLSREAFEANTIVPPWEEA